MSAKKECDTCIWFNGVLCQAETIGLKCEYKKVSLPKGTAELFNECRHDEPISDKEFKEILSKLD